MMKCLKEKETISRKLPANLCEADLALFKREFEKELEDVYLWELAKVTLLQKGLIYSRGDFHLLNFRTQRSQERWKRHARLLKYKARVLFSSLYAARLEGSFLWVTDLWSREYFHWITESLCRLKIFQEYCPNWAEYTLLLPRNYLCRPYIKESLSMIGWSKVQELTASCTVSNLTSVGHLASQGNYCPNTIKQLRSSFLLATNVASQRRIYLSRRKAVKRKIHNEIELEDLLKKHGFESFVFEDLPFREQVQLTHEASVLLSNHGAGLTNMLFMPEGSTVIEIRDRRDSLNNCYYALADACGHSYCYSFSDKRNPEGNRDTDVVVDLENLRTVLSMVCA